MQRAESSRAHPQAPYLDGRHGIVCLWWNHGGTIRLLSALWWPCEPADDERDRRPAHPVPPRQRPLRRPLLRRPRPPDVLGLAGRELRRRRGPARRLRRHLLDVDAQPVPARPVHPLTVAERADEELVLDAVGVGRPPHAVGSADLGPGVAEAVDGSAPPDAVARGSGHGGRVEGCRFRVCARPRGGGIDSCRGPESADGAGLADLWIGAVAEAGVVPLAPGGPVA